MSEARKPVIGSPGTQASIQVYGDDGVSVSDWVLTAGETLRDFKEEYRFFTDAAIVHNPWRIVLPIWNAFAAETSSPSEVRMYSAPRRVFFTGQENFDHTVFAMRAPEFARFKAFVGTMSTWDEDKKIGIRIRYQDVDIEDPSVRSIVEPGLRMIPITLFCLETTRGSYYFQADPKLQGIPRAVYDPNRIYTDTLLYFQNWLKGQQVYQGL